MFLEKIKTPGLSHLSYIIGSKGKAAVIDPRRDCDIYVEIARKNGFEITHIFETHRNEDLITGSPILADVTGATVYHGPNAAGDVEFAKTTIDGDEFKIGDATIKSLETPGHTKDHIAYALYDQNYKYGAVGVFTGDALFIGDVGRTDFYPDQMEEMAATLYDSLQKILDLGDQALLYPAHGAGSVCGSGMADREFSSIGHERKNNPRLQLSRDEFIKAKVSEVHYQPPYFKTMERLNLEGANSAPRIHFPKIMTLTDLKDANPDYIIDTRETMSFASGHLPGSLCLPTGMIPAFAGWFLDEKDSLCLIADDESKLKVSVEHLVRTGFDNILGGYTGFVPAVAKGSHFGSIPTISTEDVKSRLDNQKDNWILLDVRGQDEVEKSKIEGSKHIYIGHLNTKYKDLDPSKHYTVMCASGQRATVAAGWLQSKGFKNIDIYLGSMGAWKAAHK